MHTRRISWESFRNPLSTCLSASETIYLSLYSDFASICTLLKTRKYSICVGIVGKWGDTIGHQQLRTRPDVAAKQCFAKVSNTCNSENGKQPKKICPYEYMTNVINQIVMIKIILFTYFIRYTTTGSYFRYKTRLYDPNPLDWWDLITFHCIFYCGWCLSSK